MIEKKELLNTFQYKKGSVLAFLIALSPFIIFIHLLFDNEVNTISFFGFTYSHGYLEDQVFAWLLLKNVLPIVLLIVWYFTSNQRFKFILLAFIGFFTWMFIEVLFRYVEDVSFLIKPLTVLISLLLIFVLDYLVFSKYRTGLLNISANKLLRKHLSKTFYKNLKYRMLQLKQLNNDNQVLEYAKHLVSTNFAMKKLLSHDVKNDFVAASNRKYEIIFCGTLVFAFLLLFLHEMVGLEVKSIDLYFLVLKNNGFPNLSTFIWFFMGKAVLIICFGVWFVSCPYWWRYAILSPIILYSYQLWESFQDERYLDAAGNIKAFPLIACILGIVLILSNKLRYSILLFEMYYYLQNEIDRAISTIASEKISKDEIQLQRNREINYDSKEQNLQKKFKNFIK